MSVVSTILLVEDDLDDQSFFKEAIAGILAVVAIEIAANGDQALKYLDGATQFPDLIFMDINMPVMNGIECLTKIAAHPQLKHIPVIILSTSARHVDTATRLGARAYIQKPPTIPALKKKLTQVIKYGFIDTPNDNHCPFL